MKPGPSFSEHRTALRDLAAKAARGTLLLLALGTPSLIPTAALRADGTVSGIAPAADTTSPASPKTPQRKTCPRCGYLCDAGWAYCARCGWDLRALVGKAGENRLESISRSVVRLVAVKNAPRLDQMLSPKNAKVVQRYFTWNPGHRKVFATAVPFLEPGIFLTGARSLAWSDSIEILTYRNTTHTATVLGYDLASGIGVVRADLPDIEPIAPAAEGELPDFAWIVCYPVVFEEGLVRYLPVSLHRGRVTGQGEAGTYLASFENLLRSDHTIPQGCQGGPLIDARGALAGMVLGSPDAGLTYAIPVRDLATIVAKLAHKEDLQRPYFGMGLVVQDDRRRARFAISGAPPHPLVGFLIPGSPAAAAGVHPGDFLKAVGGETVSTVAQAGVRLLAASPGGAPVALTLLRADKEVPVSITPAIRPARILLEPSDELQEGLEANLVEISSGPTAQQGLKIVNLVRGGRGEDDEFKEGDIIVSVDHKGVRRLETFNQIVRGDNPQVFADAAKDGDTYSSYSLSLEVRAIGEDKEARSYTSRFPDLLAPPVY